MKNELNDTHIPYHRMSTTHNPRFTISFHPLKLITST